MILSVLLVTFLNLCFAQRNDIDNDHSLLHAFRSQHSWLKITSPQESMVTEKVGSYVELICEAMGSPPPTIQWFKRNMKLTEKEVWDSNTVKPSSGLAIVSSRLVINYLLPRHQDVYRCVAETGPYVSTSVTNLTVDEKEDEKTEKTEKTKFIQLIKDVYLESLYEPRVTFWASVLMETISTDAILPCKSVGNPKPALYWIDPDGKTIRNNEKFTVFPEGELKIKPLRWSDLGVYTCFVKNSVGNDSIETFLYPLKKQ